MNDYHVALYLTRGTDRHGQFLNGRNQYTTTFTADALPPVDRSRGGFWSLTMYDKDAFMLADTPNGRVDIGTVNLDANELTFGDDGTLTLRPGHEEPTDPAGRTNWLPSPADQFCLIIRAYISEDPILKGSYAFPDVVRAP